MNHIPNSNNLLLSPTSEIPDIKPITIPKEKLEEILKDLEYKVNPNPKSFKEGLNLIDTNNVKVYYRRANAYLLQNSFEEAESDFNKVLELDP